MILKISSSYCIWKLSGVEKQHGSKSRGDSSGNPKSAIALKLSDNFPLVNHNSKIHQYKTTNNKRE
jgi:hypothetical protein